MSQPWRKLRAYFVSLKFPQLSYCLETPASEASGLLGPVTKFFRGAGRSRSLGVPSFGVLSLGLMAPAAKVQTVITFLSGFTGATGHITPENMVVGGLIPLIPSQCGWTC